MTRIFRRPGLSAWLAVTACAFLSRPAAADNRRFAWTYDTGTMPRGVAEYEQWVTFKTDQQDDPRFERFEFRQEIEYGLSDRLQVALYLADWRTTRDADGHDTELSDTAVEVVANISDPVRTALGVALYGEVKLGGDLLALEGKVLLEKQVAGWVLAYNGVVEAEWEGADWVENNGELQQALGASCQVTPRIALGAEFLHEIGLQNWDETGDSVFYGGPTLNVLFGGGWWGTVSPLAQLSDLADEPDLQWRTLVGVTF